MKIITDLGYHIVALKESRDQKVPDIGQFLDQGISSDDELVHLLYPWCLRAADCQRKQVRLESSPRKIGNSEYAQNAMKHATCMQEFTLLVFVLKYLKHVCIGCSSDSHRRSRVGKRFTNTINNSARDSYQLKYT